MGFVLFSNAQLYVTRRQEIIKNGNYFLLIAPEVPQRHPSRGRAPPRARSQQRRAWKRHPGFTRAGGQTLAPWWKVGGGKLPESCSSELHQLVYMVEKREEKIYFSQVFTMIHIKSFVQNIQTKTEMEPHDQFWPSSCDTLILLDQFLLSWHSFLSCSISYVVSREGKCHLQPKIVHIIFKKARKRIQFSFVVRIWANEVRQTDKRGKAQKTQLYCFM